MITDQEDPRAVARVKNPLPAPETCRYCGTRVELLRQFVVYGRDFSRWPYLYVCVGCHARVGVHPGTFIPLGTLADGPLRDARKRCKTAFNEVLRQRFHGDQGAAYRWLAGRMRIPIDVCHWGWFEIEQCEQAGRICIESLKGADLFDSAAMNARRARERLLNEYRPRH